ncbi:hypothetical protein [Sporolactobacillus laevolacticus]|uniref:Uncharacterized protein n=1 Tax=Sporolactobacillus laevolacticus DSM 442 TaxID=1395513 RepID=V6IUZ9_9BACL|nr:hypothetical protein [Sporolactobacillus laevolacticus]EST10261.1 hypothetical protein P343_18205 [Sporolactobacillus laevolacticus DSM 442]
MIRKMIIIKFLDRRHSTWYKVDQKDIECNHRHYYKGDIIEVNGKRYCVIDDHTYLRVQMMSDNVNLYHSIPEDPEK